MAAKYYVEVKGESGAGPWGPYELPNAKAYARISSAKGKHSRIITRGLQGPVVRVYTKGKRTWPTKQEHLKGLKTAEHPKVLQPARKKAKRKKNPRRKYIFPKTKKFRVDNTEHERRALSYAKAGRIAVDQIAAVFEYLANDAADPDVKEEASKAIDQYNKTGKGLIRESLKSIRKRAETVAAKKNPKKWSGRKPPFRTKQGQYGTLYLYEMSYKDLADPMNRWKWKTWAYDADHAEEKFYEGPDAEGWEVTSRPKRIREKP